MSACEKEGEEGGQTLVVERVHVSMIDWSRYSRGQNKVYVPSSYYGTNRLQKTV